MTLLGDCRDEELIESIFGSVSEFACQVENKGNNFYVDNFYVKHNPKTDIHTFFEVDK